MVKGSRPFVPPPGMAVKDSDNWIERWLNLHPSTLFARHFGKTSLALLDEAPDGPGMTRIRFREGQEVHDIEFRYALESHPKGRVLHVFLLRSEGDPLPDLTDEREPIDD